MTELLSYTFFNLRFVRYVTPAGEAVRVARLTSTPRAEADDLYIYTKGKYIGVGENVDYTSIRTMGDFSRDLEPEPRGIYVKTAETDSEWWCVDYNQLKSAGYDADKVYLEPGTRVLPAGFRYTLFTGSFSVNGTDYATPLALEIGAEDREIIVTETVIGYQLIPLQT